MPTRFEDVYAIAHDQEHFSSRSITVTPVPHEMKAPPTTASRSMPIIGRPTGPHMVAPPAAPGVPHAPVRSGSRDPGPLPLARSTASSTRAAPTPPKATPSRSRCGSSPECSESRRACPTPSPAGCAASSRSASPNPEVRVQITHGDHRASSRVHRRTPRQAGRRPDQRAARRRGRRASGLRGQHRRHLRLLLVAGIDTTWSAIGSSLWHLATHPEDRRAPGR